MNAINYLKMDLKLMGKSLKTLLFLPLVAIILMAAGNTVFGLTYIFFLMIVINTAPFSISSNENYSKLYYSLPSKISDMVKGRYLFFISIAVIVWTVAGISAFFTYTMGKVSLFELFGCLLSGAAVTVICSVQYPLYYKFGITKGRILSMIIYMFPAIVAFAIPSILVETGGTMSSIDLSQSIIYIAIILAIVISYFISYFISYKICANKEI